MFTARFGIWKKSTRIEHRVVGSDVNPYLAMAACLASGLYGIKNKLKLDTPETKANGYDVKKGLLPSNLWDASQKMKNSKIAKELFGNEFVDHLTKTERVGVEAIFYRSNRLGN